MSNAKNHHGQWVVFPDDGHGQNLTIFEQCDYCGSITPESFIEYLSKDDTESEVADLKYGYPHKVYLTIPNPNKDELRIDGAKSAPDIDGSHPHDVWRCFTHGDTPCDCPKVKGSGVWSRQSFGTYPKLHVKFYLEHLILGVPNFMNSVPLLRDQLGLTYYYEGDKLMYSFKRTNS